MAKTRTTLIPSFSRRPHDDTASRRISVTDGLPFCAVASLAVDVAAPVEPTVALLRLVDGVGLIAPPAAQPLAAALHVPRQRGVADAALGARDAEDRFRVAVLGRLLVEHQTVDVGNGRVVAATAAACGDCVVAGDGVVVAATHSVPVMKVPQSLLRKCAEEKDKR